MAEGLDVLSLISRVFVPFDRHNSNPLPVFTLICVPCRVRTRAIIRANILRPRLPFRLRHLMTSMHPVTRSLLQLTRSRPTQYASPKRGLRAFQSVPRPKPRVGAAGPLRVLCPDVPPFVCRRMFHASSGEPILVP